MTNTPRFKRTEDNKRLVGVPQYGKEPLGRAYGIRFPKDIEEELKSLDDKQNFIREAVREKLEKEKCLS